MAKTTPQNAPQPIPQARAPLKNLDVSNKTLEIGRIVTDDGEAIPILYATHVETGEVEAVRWEDASPLLRAAARRWACDPLGLLRQAEQTFSGQGAPSPSAPSSPGLPAPSEDDAPAASLPFAG